MIDFESLFDPASKTGDAMGIRWRASQKVRLTLTLDLLRKQVPPEQIKRILDAGCALADFTRLVESTCGPDQICALDIAHNATRILWRDFPHYWIVNAALPDLPLRGQSFDLVVAIEVINYLSAADRHQAVANITNVLRPGGWFLFSGVLDDGSIYFAPGEAQDTIGQHLNIVAEAYVYNALYTSLELPLLGRYRRLRSRRSGLDMRIGRLLHGDGSSAPVSLKRRIMRTLFQVHVVQVLAKESISFREAFLYWFLGLTWPVRLFGFISRWFLRERGRSHVLILARKD